MTVKSVDAPTDLTTAAAFRYFWAADLFWSHSTYDDVRPWILPSSYFFSSAFQSPQTPLRAQVRRCCDISLQEKRIISEVILPLMCLSNWELFHLSPQKRMKNKEEIKLNKALSREMDRESGSLIWAAAWGPEKCDKIHKGHHFGRGNPHREAQEQRWEIYA